MSGARTAYRDVRMRVCRASASAVVTLQCVAAFSFHRRDPAFSYDAARRFCFMPPASVARAPGYGGSGVLGGALLLSTSPADADPPAVVDHASFSANDAWEDHYDERSGAGDGAGRPRAASHAYVSRLVHDMDAGRRVACFEEHRRAAERDRSSENARSPAQEDEATARRPKNEKTEPPTTPDAGLDQSHRQLRLFGRHLPDPLWSQIRLEAQHALTLEPDAGSQLYQHVIRQVRTDGDASSFKWMRSVMIVRHKTLTGYLIACFSSPR